MRGHQISRSTNVEDKAVVNGSSLVAHNPEFNEFLRVQRTALLHFLRRRLPSDEDAQDATQESLTRLLRYSDSEPADAWKPLLYRIASNIACDQARMRQSHCTEDHISLDDEEIVSEEPTPEQLLTQQQEMAILQRAILALPERCRQVYLLHRMHNMTYVQIAAHYGLSQKTVEKHVSKALAALRAAGKAYTETLQEK